MKSETLYILLVYGNSLRTVTSSAVRVEPEATATAAEEGALCVGADLTTTTIAAGTFIHVCTHEKYEKS